MTTDVFVRHYTEVADASPVPVLLYNVTMFTGVNLPADAVRAAGRPSRTSSGMKESGSDSGADRRLRGAHARRLHGARRVGDDALPRALRRMRRRRSWRWRRCSPTSACSCRRSSARRRLDEARALQRRLMPLARSVGTAHGVPGLKAALDLIGYAGGPPRPPLRPVSSEVVEIIRRQLDALIPADAERFRATLTIPLTTTSVHQHTHATSFDRTYSARARPEPHRSARDARAWPRPCSAISIPTSCRCSTMCAPRCSALFNADEQSLTLATSGTGTSAMEAAVANVVSDGMRGVVIVTGYFGDRLAQIFERYGARVRRIDVEWGRAVDPQLLRDELSARRRRRRRHRACRNIHRRAATR